MRARYYNPEIKRFINQDVLIGTIADSPSMNRYAYVHGNPISLADPFGLSPQTNWGNLLGHMALSAASMLMFIPTPVTFAIGAAATIANTAWYAAEGNYFEAVCSALTVFGGATTMLNALGKARTITSAGCTLLQITKTMSSVGAIADGVYDIKKVYDKNYEKYVVNGEDFSLKEAASDVLRITLDSVAIAGGVKGLQQADINYCFVAGTLITMAEGHKAIEEIQAGDKVLAMDYETGEVAVKEVVQTFVNETEELIHVHVNGEVISTTPNHPFYVAKFGWTSAINLRAGDVLVLSNGEYVLVEAIQPVLIHIVKKR